MLDDGQVHFCNFRGDGSILWLYSNFDGNPY